VYKSSTLHIAALLDHGVRVLVYAGKYDLACNFVANDRVTRDLEWHGTQQFVAQPLRDWVVDGQPAGETRAFGGLTFATIRDAGHQVRLGMSCALRNYIINATRFRTIALWNP
jgi:carboxypeptidase C (cathepsin A)